MAIRAYSRFAEFTHHMSSTLSRIFVVQISGSEISRIHYDQAHEQSNKTIKSIKWPIDFVNLASDELQRKWEITRPEIAEYLEKVESKILKGTNKNDTHHHEDNPIHNAMFRKDYTTLIGKFLPVNPFLEDSFIKVSTDIAYSEEVCVLSSILYQKQVKDSIKNLLILGLSDARNLFLIQLRKIIL